MRSGHRATLQKGAQHTYMRRRAYADRKLRSSHQLTTTGFECMAEYSQELQEEVFPEPVSFPGLMLGGWGGGRARNVHKKYPDFLLYK